MAEAIKTFQNFMESIGIPGEVVVAILGVICITEFAKRGLAILEKFLEEKYKKEIKFFDHTKILLTCIFSIFATITLVGMKTLTWPQVPMYSLGIMGASALLYDVVLKKAKKFIEDL